MKKIELIWLNKEAEKNNNFSYLTLLKHTIQNNSCIKFLN